MKIEKIEIEICSVLDNKRSKVDIMFAKRNQKWYNKEDIIKIYKYKGGVQKCAKTVKLHKD